MNTFKILFKLVVCLIMFEGKSQRITECFLTATCSDVKIKIHENTGKIAYYNNLICVDCDDCTVFNTSYNQFSWINNDGLGLYTQPFPNLYFENGQIKRELVFVSDTILAYNHYDKNSQLIGQEFFTHDVENRLFFVYVEKWWRMINGTRTEIDYPDYYFEEFYDY